jgi:hypothetical protein
MENMTYQSEYKNVAIAYRNGKCEVHASKEIERYCSWFYYTNRYLLGSFESISEAQNLAYSIAPIYTNPSKERYLQVITAAL